MRNRAIPIFEAHYPTSKALFAFDNAINHAAFSILLLRPLSGKNEFGIRWETTPKDAQWEVEGVTYQPICFSDTNSDVTLRGERAIELKCYPLKSFF